MVSFYKSATSKNDLWNLLKHWGEGGGGARGHGILSCNCICPQGCECELPSQERPSSLSSYCGSQLQVKEPCVSMQFWAQSSAPTTHSSISIAKEIIVVKQ